MGALDAMLEEARATYIRDHPESASLSSRANRVLPGGNTRSVLDFQPFPFRVATVDGGYLVDVDGNRYLDLLGNYSAGLLGHRPEAVASAVADAMGEGWARGAISTREAQLAELVIKRFASIEKVRFTNSGTEANLMAIAIAKHHTGRNRVVVFDGGYHGGVLYFGSGGSDLLVPHEWARVTYNDVRAVERVFAENANQIACVLVEPMLAASGCIPGTPEFLSRLREVCSESGAILVFDEVMTSRLSPGGAQELLDITPDMTTLGKYLAGGLTIGAFGGSAGIMAAFDPASGGKLTHGGTFNNNELSMAAGVAALSRLLEAETIQGLNVRGDHLRDELNLIFSEHGLPMSVTGVGSLMTIHGMTGEIDHPGQLAHEDQRLKELLFFHLLAKGIYVARRGFVALSVEISDDEIEGVLEVVDDWAAQIAAAV